MPIELSAHVEAIGQDPAAQSALLKALASEEALLAYADAHDIALTSQQIARLRDLRAEQGTLLSDAQMGSLAGGMDLGRFFSDSFAHIGR